MVKFLRNTVVISILAIAVVLSIVLGVYYSMLTKDQNVSSSETTSFSVSKISTYEAWTRSFQNGLNLPSNETFRIPTSATLFVYEKYYYFNSTSTQPFNFSGGQQIGIEGFDGHSSFNADSNFSVISNSTAPVQMGGPQNLSEGMRVMYSISLKGAYNGTYTLSFGWLYPSMSACSGDFQLQVGSGLPNYGFQGSCTAPLSYHYPLNSQGFVDGFLFAEIYLVSSD
ncbi:MAG TPA: hypothetical protein VJN71_01930 [Nitrososphaerales archaeon]|nr:hypothetical protein [Nitrososphaerales archaeon]